MPKTLLLADDSVVIQKLVGLSFANEDVEIITTDNGDDAVIRAREIKPDVVLADVVMPGKSGYEVCEAIKQDPDLAHIPVLLLTGTFEAFDEGRAASAGADGQITKPFEAQSLVERVSEVMNAPPAAPAQAEQPVVAEASSTDFDFFDPGVSTLSAEDSASRVGADQPAADRTPAIDVSDNSLFGAPGDGATDELDTQGGGMALGESVARGGSQDSAGSSLDPNYTGTATGTATGYAGIESDATVVALPEPVTPLPPSRGDPLAEFERDLDLNEAPVTPSTAVDFDSALDAVPSDPGATIVAGIDDTNASTSPNYGPDNVYSEEPGETASAYPSSSGPTGPSSIPADDEFEDLTIHAPSAAIDQAVATAPSPTAIEEAPASDRLDAGATVVANLDVSLAESSPSISPDAPNPLDLGPSNVSPDELDFAFDVSEQAPISDSSQGLDESFSSLMDISESQILVGPDSGSEEIEAEAPAMDDAFAAGYDVSVSDLATASTSVPEMPEATPTPEATQPPEPALPPVITPEAPAPAPTVSASQRVAIGRMSINDDLEIGTPAATSSGGAQIPDLSPIIEQRIQETLEKVAWEAFSDLSETIVKQVIGRVEKIAWEVIPQMAETLVREEIRKMKGEND